MKKVDDISQSLDMASAMSKVDRQKSIRWLSRQNDLVLYDVFILQKNHFHRLRSNNVKDDLTLLSIVSLFLALKETIAASNPVKRKNRSSDFGFLRQVSKNRAKQFKKARKKEKYDKLMNLQSTVLSLINQNRYSYRDVAEFLSKYHKLEVSHTTVGSFYRKFKKEPKNV